MGCINERAVCVRKNTKITLQLSALRMSGSFFLTRIGLGLGREQVGGPINYASILLQLALNLLEFVWTHHVDSPILKLVHDSSGKVVLIQE